MGLAAAVLLGATVSGARAEEGYEGFNPVIRTNSSVTVSFGGGYARGPAALPPDATPYTGSYSGTPYTTTLYAPAPAAPVNYNYAPAQTPISYTANPAPVSYRYAATPAPVRYTVAALAPVAYTPVQYSVPLYPTARPQAAMYGAPAIPARPVVVPYAVYQPVVAPVRPTLTYAVAQPTYAVAQPTYTGAQPAVPAAPAYTTPVVQTENPKVIVRPKIVWVEGQPVRNFLRAITP
jgi:hypothetical protein